MDEQVAREIAMMRHSGQLDRSGLPVVEHLRSVAAAVSPGNRAVAWLHDLLERTPTRRAELRARGLSPIEVAALDLLTRGRDEDYAAYVMRIASARGPAGRLAREVKLADLDDHLSGRSADTSGLPYDWARRVLLAVTRDGEHRRGATRETAPITSG